MQIDHLYVFWIRSNCFIWHANSRTWVPTFGHKHIHVFTLFCGSWGQISKNANKQKRLLTLSGRKDQVLWLFRWEFWNVFISFHCAPQKVRRHRCCMGIGGVRRVYTKENDISSLLIVVFLSLQDLKTKSLRETLEHFGFYLNSILSKQDNKQQDISLGENCFVAITLVSEMHGFELLGLWEGWGFLFVLDVKNRSWGYATHSSGSSKELRSFTSLNVAEKSRVDCRMTEGGGLSHVHIWNYLWQPPTSTSSGYGSWRIHLDVLPRVKEKP